MSSTTKVKHVGNTVLPPGEDVLRRIKICPCSISNNTTWSVASPHLNDGVTWQTTSNSGYRPYCPKCKGKGMYEYEVRAHWYYQVHVFCPICMRGKTYRERKYNFRPDDPKERHEYVDRYCGCNG